MGFPGGASGKEHACHCRRLKRCGFDPWLRKVPWRRAWQPTPVFLPGGRQSMGSQRIGHDLAPEHSTALMSIVDTGVHLEHG